MIKRVQLIGHTKTAADLFLGKTREVTVNTTDLALRVHDGASVGGFELARANMANVPVAGGAVDGKMTASQADDLAAAKTSIDTHVGSTAGHPIATTGADGFESAADKTKLNGIETAATADQTAAELLTAIKTVDGASSGLDADLLDGLDQTAAATVDTIMRRDSAGRSKVVDPSASGDIATKAYVDSIIAFEAGTVMLFFQDDAPTGWTRLTAQNDKALRIVSNNGGVAAGIAQFTNVFGAGKLAGATTLTAAQSGLPAHEHTYNKVVINTGAGVIGDSGFAADQPISAATTGGAAAGAASSHNHTLSLDLQYIDVIMASKD